MAEEQPKANGGPWWAKLVTQTGITGILLVVLYGIWDLANKTIVPIAEALVGLVEKAGGSI